MSLVHYAQGVNTGIFRMYNHGKERNLELYGQEEPPMYDFSKITAPVALYWGENDWLGPPAVRIHIINTNTNEHQTLEHQTRQELNL